MSFAIKGIRETPKRPTYNILYVIWWVSTVPNCYKNTQHALKLRCIFDLTTSVARDIWDVHPPDCARTAWRAAAVQKSAAYAKWRHDGGNDLAVQTECAASAVHAERR